MAKTDEDGWFALGVTPEPGRRYEFEDYTGARFVGMFERHRGLRHPVGDGDQFMVVGTDAEEIILRIEFSDRISFETNMPVRFRLAE